MENYGSLAGILLYTDYLSAVYQPPYCSKPVVSEQEGTPLTVVTYNASHFYWNRKYTMNEAAAYIKQLQPDIICFQEAPGDGYYHRDSIRYAFDYVLYKLSAGVQTIYRLRFTAVIRSIR